MNVKEWIIKKLEKDVEPTAGHIDLEELNEEERKKLFLQFGEGDENLTSFLETSYNCGAPSMFCCCGHGIHSAYVTLKVTEDNIELLQKLGKVLSNYGVTTNFEDNHIRGLIVDYRSMESFSTEWLGTAKEIMESPELYDDSNPSIFYHEKICSSYKPFLFDFKKKLLNYMRKGEIKQFPIRRSKKRKKKF